MKTPLTCLLCLAFIAGHTQTPAGDSVKQYRAEQKVVARSFSNFFYPNYATLHALAEPVFVHSIDSARAVFQALLNRYKSALPPAYAADEQTGIDYYFDKLLIDYPDNHELHTGKAQPSSIPARMAVHQPDFNRRELLENSDFREYVKSFLAIQLRDVLKKDTKEKDNRELQAVWRLIPRYFTDSVCRNYWRYQYLSAHIENNGIKHIEPLYQAFLKNCRDTAMRSRITAMYREDEEGRQGHIMRNYKTVNGADLDLHVFVPETKDAVKRPVIVYFHGGSWSEGKPDWFFESCKAYAKKGWVAIAAEYRTYGRHGTLPFAAVKDARSAVRWIRQHANEYDIDTARIVASGNSAGGHLVLCTALASQWNERTDDKRYSATPNLLLVNAGVYDLTDTRTQWIRRNPADAAVVKQISPNHLPLDNMPPALLLHGTNDQSVPFPSAQVFADRMKQAGKVFEFYPLTGAEHFIWYDPKFSARVSELRAQFLEKMGYGK